MPKIKTHKSTAKVITKRKNDVNNSINSNKDNVK